MNLKVQLFTFFLTFQAFVQRTMIQAGTLIYGISNKPPSMVSIFVESKPILLLKTNM